MNLGEGIAFSSLAIGFITFIYKITNDETKKRTRIFERIDEIKKENNEKSQSKEICDIVHKNVDNRLEKIEKHTDCIPAIKAGIDLLLQENGIKNG